MIAPYIFEEFKSIEKFGSKKLTQLAVCATLLGTLQSCNTRVDEEFYESGQYKCEYVDGKYVHNKLIVEGDSVILRLSIEGEGSEDGVREGKRVVYYDNGQINWKGNYKNSKKDGEWTWFYSGGNKAREGNYKNGKEDGHRISYYPNGRIEEEGNYKNGKKDGQRVLYYPNGGEKQYKNYKNGTHQWSSTFFDESGKISSEFSLKDGKKLWIKHNEGGQNDTIPLQ